MGVSTYTYQEHTKKFNHQPKMRNIPAYLNEFILNDPTAKGFIQRTYEGQTGSLSRIFNDLPSLDTKTINELAIEYLHEIKRGNFQGFTLRKMSDLLHEFLDCKKYLDEEHTIPNPHYGQLTPTISETLAKAINRTPEEFLLALYGDPIDPKKVKAIEEQIIASLMIAITSRFTTMYALSQTSEGMSFKQLQNYEYLSSGIKFDAEGNPSKIETPTFISLQELTLDHITQGRELNPNDQTVNQGLRKFVNDMGIVITSWSEQKKKQIFDGLTNTSLDDVLVIIGKTSANAQALLESPNNIVTPDYVSQRKKMIGEFIEEKIQDIQKEIDAKNEKSSQKSLLPFFGKKGKKEATKEIDQLKELIVALKTLEKNINGEIQPEINGQPSP
ncbi:hypothetical protein [Legionella fairfieldensis]|uniref:hypothetical protein n=1 Tax=Legionella fairfieldensis TaxID=45064 RepID=UPI000491084E|nr:hypothetical protein [Legionella fairfieldensis]